ncbi:MULTISPECIES: hypothetical protein [unclassified Kribbella]|uniref:hypothetical protein n=1 Tax=unclassified Kribbella TaxID=2644121 RepID=UPI00301A0BB5
MTVRGKQAKMTIVAVVLAVAATGGCGGQQSGSGSAPPSATSTVSPDLVRIRGVFTDGDGGSEPFEVIADGNRRFRLTMLTGPGYYQVWDGKALLLYNPDEDPKYQRIENPGKDELPDSTFFYRPDTEEFEQLCPAAKRLGTKTLFGRTAVRYHCDKVESSESVPSMDAREIALDEKTGLVMVYGGSEVITEVTFGPVIKADTFSTELPPGAGPTVVPPEGESTDVPPDAESTEVPPDGGDVGPYEIATFRLRAVGGGFVNGTSYRGQPFVIVAGSADGIRTAIGRLLPMTRAGTPPVVGFLLVLPAEDWKGSLLNPEDVDQLADSISKSAGTFPVPVGLDFKGAATEMFTGNITAPPDPTQVTIALVASDGTFAHVTPAHEATDENLRTWIAALT